MFLWKSSEERELEKLIKECQKKYRPAYLNHGRKPQCSTTNILMCTAAGDYVGSIYEGEKSFKKQDITADIMFSEYHRFTDDTYMSIAIDAAMQEITKERTSSLKRAQIFAKHMKLWAKAYPNAGYGCNFAKWALEDAFEYQDSYGNGAIMRIGVIARYSNSINECIKNAVCSVWHTHRHPDSIKAACVFSVLMWMAIYGCSKTQMKSYIDTFYSSANRNDIGDETRLYSDSIIEEIANKQEITSLHVGLTLVLAFVCFYSGANLIDSFKNGMTFRGDTDTILAIIGSLGGAYYGIKELDSVEFLKAFKGIYPGI